MLDADGIVLSDENRRRTQLVPHKFNHSLTFVLPKARLRVSRG
jgi:hypothetical protein